MANGTHDAVCHGQELRVIYKETWGPGIVRDTTVAVEELVSVVGASLPQHPGPRCRFAPPLFERADSFGASVIRLCLLHLLCLCHCCAPADTCYVLRIVLALAPVLDRSDGTLWIPSRHIVCDLLAAGSLIQLLFGHCDDMDARHSDGGLLNPVLSVRVRLLFARPE